MPRWFNIAGPCNAERHYMLPVMRRLPKVRRLIDQESYFVLHAPRQVGKTTALLTLAHELTSEGRYVAVLLSMEVGAGFLDDTGAAELAILDAWRGRAQSRLPGDLQPPPWPDTSPGRRIASALQAWARAAPRPLVVFLDEIDALQGPLLVSVLRQLRDGYPDHPHDFPHALALVGLRDVRDYKLDPSDGSSHSASPFNIKDASLTLRNFTADEVAELYAQHTEETGQAFSPEAVGRAFELTDGQPWLVNALAKEIVEELVPDPLQTITELHVDAAKDVLIRRQDTHLDSLAERLREPRVRQVIEPILAGTALGLMPEDDLRYVQDLGLVRHSEGGGLVVANPIYREVIPNALASIAIASLPQIRTTWLGPDGKLDEDRLLAAFLGFWRQHAEPLFGAAPYHEVAPHLVLLAFLHRVVNGGGSIEREYAIGSGRMDLLVRHHDRTLAVELKVWRKGRPDPLPTGLEQLDRYLAGLGLDHGWLVIFDRRSDVALAERTNAETRTSPGGRRVVVVRA
ncbi:ATP-binding protein [Paraliomyxa miuraensis]|uniref:ATP-binding protein n=1 Tax=Paraliomyxa miuraensis TaxID=376150 RepID=UPI002250805F|nr:ATP-binding protein [Paraliomyxa miuraensis]MCX4241211.1 ATP-binding protein [Paraliomyxa miuraensis]